MPAVAAGVGAEEGGLEGGGWKEFNILLDPTTTKETEEKGGGEERKEEEMGEEMEDENGGVWSFWTREGKLRSRLDEERGEI